MSLPSLPPGYPPPYNPAAWSTLIRREKCPGIPSTIKKDCQYQATPNSGPVTWKCKAGFFCLGSDFERKCNPGFYCPEDTILPNYCPEGWMCSADTSTIEICPKGYYCPKGTVRNGTVSGALSCGGILAYCPEGSGSASKVGVTLVFLLIAAIIWLFFHWKKKSDEESSMKHERELKKIPIGAEKPQLHRLDHTFDIEFKNLGLTLPNGVTIMKNVSGQLRSGRCTAIMGPSGAGKTTFVTLLTGKVKKTNGSVLINGKTDELSKYSKLIGYVPQEDIMIRELTVRDVLMHSARMRLPRDWDYQKVKSKVIEIISFLGMSHVSGTIIGDEVTRGISGGQRKRVNIGMELVAEPSVLFLDEPTSGLDSSTAYEVCANLRNIAEQQGLTVGAVIHSPSPATFRQFHDFLLLGKGGQVVYMGPREDCVAYFESIGFSLPPDDSPSDYFMDVVSGKVANEFDPQFVYTDLFEYWSCRIEGRPNKLAGMRRYSPKEALERKKDHLKSLENPEIVVETPGAVFNPKKSFKVDRENFVYILAGAQRIAREWGSFFWDVFQEFGTFVISIINFILRREDPIRQVQPFHIQLWLLLKRAYLQVYKSAGTLISEMALHFSAGFFISIAVQNFDYVGKQPPEVCASLPWNLFFLCNQQVDNIGSAGMFICLGILFAGISVGGNTFGREKVVFWRDTASGMPAIPYFLAKLIVDLPRIVGGATFFSIALILLFPYRQLFRTLYLMVLSLYFMAFMMGYWLSAAFPMSKVPLYATGFSLLWALVLSGILPSLWDVVNDYPSAVQWLWQISGPRWAIEGFWLEEIQGRPWVEKFDEPPNKYKAGNYGTGITNVFIIAAGWALLAFLGLKLFNREKQK